MKFALLSVTYAGVFYKGKILTLEEQVYKAKMLGFDALSIESKRPIASPIDLSASQRKRLREISAGEGIALCAVESLSNFCSDIVEERENNRAMMRLTLELARDLGIETVKVFAAWPGIIDDQEVGRYVPYEKGNYYSRLYPADLRKWQHAVHGIREVADWAVDMGITLALQNHAPVTRPGHEDVLAMQQEIDRPNVKLCLDVPLYYTRQDNEYVQRSVTECAENIILTHYGTWNIVEKPDGEIIQVPAHNFGEIINYEAFFAALHKVDYNGYLVSESCTPIVTNHQIGGIEEVDKAVITALKYMKGIVQIVSNTKQECTPPNI